MKITKKSSISFTTDCVYLLTKTSELASCKLNKVQEKYVRAELKENGKAVINAYSHLIFICLPKKSKEERYIQLDEYRRYGATVVDALNQAKVSTAAIIGAENDALIAVAEGMYMKNYQFLKYFEKAKEMANSMKSLQLKGKISATDVTELNATLESNTICRDLVNEPFSYLTAPQMAKDIQKIGKKCGFTVQVFNKKKIESLKMGGLLAVNRGSVDPPTFSIMEWKPKNAKNKKPIVLVGKGVVYDTGGLSLKPTANSMDQMKCDMGGAAMMIGTMAAVSKAKLPLHVIGLIPATDNRPGVNAYAPGDVITMHSGKTVEVLNTDAEGRMLLADALSYAKKYDPELVMNAATLTGAAVRAIGDFASCVMGTASQKEFDRLEKSGERTFERVVRMPFWKEYGDMIKSDIADIKNLGGASAGQITAGKFLEHFTDYPWIHIDIAGPSFISSPDSYRGKWATGYGVRLLFDMLKNR